MSFDGLRRFFRLDRPADVDRAVKDELDFHFDSKVRELMGRGMSEAAAREEAERRFGDVGMTRRELGAIDRARVGSERRSQWWQGFWQDLRYALRGLRLKPGFTLGVVITLGLGIGANATMFGIVDRLLFRTPPGVVNAGELNRIYWVFTFNGKEHPSGYTSYRRYADVRTMATGLRDVAVYFDPQLVVGAGEDARELQLQGVSPSFFHLLGVQPAIGRFFADEEDRLPSGSPVVVLGYAYWRTQYGGRESVLGQTLQIGKREYTIIGVAPRGFRGVLQQEPVAFIPSLAAMTEVLNPRVATTYNFQGLGVLVRRSPGMSEAAASAMLTSVFRRSAERELDENPGGPPLAMLKPRAIAGSILEERGPKQSDETRVALWLIGVSAIVLIIACANVGNLLLARAFGRRREIAVRLALGISRSRLLAQLLTESILLALLGGLAGIAVAQWGGGVLRATLLPDITWTSAIADPRVLGFALIAATASGLLAGLAPAIHAGRADVAASLKAGVREGTYHRSRQRTALLVLQGALSVVLLVGAGLFVRSFHNVRSIRLGYDPDRVLDVQIQMRGVTLDTAAAAQLRVRLVDAAKRMPGVEDASRASNSASEHGISRIFVDGRDTAFTSRLFVQQQGAAPGYFATMGTRILRGRDFGPDDRAGTAPVMVVSQSLAKTLWPREDALGKCIRLGQPTAPCRAVVGIAEDIKWDDFGAPSLGYYVPMAQGRQDRGGLLVRTRRDASTMVEAVRRGLQQELPGTAYLAVTPLQELLVPEQRSWQLGATMFSVFGVLALIVAAVGLYSVIAYGVAQRTHELGVRVALGAQPENVVRLVMGEALKLALVAAALGTAGALLSSRFIASLLFETSPRDPVILAGVATTLLAIAAIASLLPAWRAARVDPNEALRAD